MHELVGAAAAITVALRASGGSRGSGNWTGELVDRRVGGFISWPAIQDAHGAWLCIQAIDDGWRHAAVIF